MSVARARQASLALSSAALLLIGVGAVTSSADARPLDIRTAAVSSPRCQVDHAHVQMCPAVLDTARVHKHLHVTVARYEDVSACHFAPNSDAPGDNGRYVARDVRVNWGDGTNTTKALAKTGHRCHGTTNDNETGEVEPVIGKHIYKKRGSYRVTAYLVYLRGSGNTYQNCRKVTGGPKYNVITNCVAFGAPVSSKIKVK